MKYNSVDRSIDSVQTRQMKKQQSRTKKNDTPVTTNTAQHMHLNGQDSMHTNIYMAVRCICTTLDCLPTVEEENSLGF